EPEGSREEAGHPGRFPGTSRSVAPAAGRPHALLSQPRDHAGRSPDPRPQDPAPDLPLQVRPPRIRRHLRRLGPDGADNRVHLDDEPEARERVRTLLREVMTDELAHVGQRRNFLGPLGLRAAHATVESMYRAFFRDIPETKLLFNVEQMVQDGRRSTTAAFASLDASLRAP